MSNDPVRFGQWRDALRMRSIDFWRFEGGRFVEHWDELITLDVFTEVGAVQLKGPAS